MRTVAARLDAGHISFNVILQESVENQDHHLIVKVLPQTTRWAGAEFGSGIIINPVAPEYAALWYKGRAS